MIYIHGTFKNIKNDTIEVQLKSNNGNEEYIIGDNISSHIQFSSDPVEIETECDDMFTTVIKKSCTINLVTDIYLGDKLFAANEKSVSCKVYKNGVIVFDGFVEPTTFSQGWTNKWEEFSLNCIDYLGCLQYEYLTDKSNYQTVKANTDIISFKSYIQQILGNYVYWDDSKYVGNESVFDATIGVSMNVFLGDSEDDIMNNEEILHEILQYLNLHIIQEGSYFIVFDWNTIKNSRTSIFKNIFNSTTTTIPTSPLTISKDRYASNDTQLTMSEVYNQIEATCEFEDKDEIISDPLDTEVAVSYNQYPDGGSKFLREYFVRDVGFNELLVFKKICEDGVDGTIPDVDSDVWEINEYFFHWLYNPSWTLTYNNQNIETNLQYSGTQPINEWKILELMKQNKFFPALLGVSKADAITHSQRYERKGVLSNYKNYLVISVNGTDSDSNDNEATQSEIDQANLLAAGGDNSITNTTGLLTFNSEESTLYSPNDENTTNWLIFSGNITLAPVMYKSLLGMRSDNLLANCSFNQQITDLNFTDHLGLYWYRYKQSPYNTNGDVGYFAQQFYKNTNTAPPNQRNEVPDNDAVFIYPFNSNTRPSKYNFEYSAKGDSNDTLELLPVLWCSLKIGDYYLVELNPTTGARRERPKYGWYKENEIPAGLDATFTLGFDPQHGEPIIGKEYPFADTMDGSVSTEKGTAVKIPYDENMKLYGKVQFKILGVVNGFWNDITRRHPTLFRSTKYYDNYKLLMNHISSIWIKDFKVKIVSDNASGIVSEDSKDIVYISDENRDYLKKKDDITFKINTQPTTDELIRLGIDTNISNTNVINVTTGEPLQEITDKTTNQTDRPERLYIDQYYGYYSSPKVIMTTTLKDTTTYPFWNKYTLSGFSGMIPLSVSKNLKNNSITITSRQS